PSPALDDAARIDRIRALEELKGAVAAAQAREAVEFKASQLADQKAAGVPARDLGKGISGQLALARRESPHRAARLMGLAEALVGEMPHTMAALSSGVISEWRATIVASQTACLSVDDRRRVDARLAARLETSSDRQLFTEACQHAYAIDPLSFVTRGRKAVADRRVTIRPAPDTMAIVSALLPAAQGVALFAALGKEADSRRSRGDARSRGQLMADTLVERITGQTAAHQVPVEVRLVMTDRGLFAGDSTPARLEGYGPLPAATARGLIANLDPDTRAWLRRLDTDPVSGRLTGMDTTRRLFESHHRRVIEVRDEICRTPWCGAPIRHADHVVPVEHGGQTSEPNGQGLCEACNHAKQAYRWRSQPGTGGASESVHITTPTGHTYTSRPPPLPGAPPGRRVSRPRRIDVFWSPLTGATPAA
ncbi:MAG: HNH endonuclease, partial [Nocardioidaceae bacterium]